MSEGKDIIYPEGKFYIDGKELQGFTNGSDLDFEDIPTVQSAIPPLDSFDITCKIKISNYQALNLLAMLHGLKRKWWKLEFINPIFRRRVKKKVDSERAYRVEWK